MAFFDARLQGTPVRGAVIVQLNDGGGGGVAILFDRPADIARSFPAMARQLGGMPGAGRRPGRSGQVALQQQTTPDGKAAIGVPPGWRISGYANGAVDVAGPQGQLVDVGIYLPIIVRPSLRWARWPGRSICRSSPIRRRRCRVVSQAHLAADRGPRRRRGPPTSRCSSASPRRRPPARARPPTSWPARGSAGGRILPLRARSTPPRSTSNSWAYYYSTVAAPDGVFQRDFALMLNVWRSWSLNQQMLRDRMQDAANKMSQDRRSCARPRVDRAKRTTAPTRDSATTCAASMRRRPDRKNDRANSMARLRRPAGEVGPAEVACS